MSFGKYGARVRVYQNVIDGPYYGVINRAGCKAVALKTRDSGVAAKWGEQEAAKLVLDLASAADPILTLSQAIKDYLHAKGDTASRGQREANQRNKVLWPKFLGADTPVRKITLSRIEEFVKLRTSGQITGRGEVQYPPKPVDPGTAAQDVLWLKVVLNHVLKHQDEENGVVWLRANPLRRFEWTRNPMPKQPVCDEKRFKKICKAAGRVKMMVTWGDGKRKMVRSPVKELIELAAFTGARIGAIVKVRFADLHLDVVAGCPYGLILFPGSGRKNKSAAAWEGILTKESRPTVDRLVVEYLLRSHDADDPGWLFPSPTDPKRHLDEDFANVLHARGEAAAKLEHLRGGAWHPYRRKHDSELSHISPSIAASTTGRRDIGTMLRSYTKIPRSVKYDALTNRRPLEE